MPKFFKKNLLFKQNLQTPELPSPLTDHELPSPLSELELPSPPPNTDSNYYAIDERVDEYDPIRDLVVWQALSRPFQKRDRSYFTTAGVLLLLFCLIAFLANQVMLMFVLLALGFAFYALNFTAPEEIEYKVSTQGVTIAGHFYHWQMLDSFWITHKDGFNVMHIATHLKFPGVLILVLNNNEAVVRRYVARFLPFHEVVPKSIIESWAEGLQKHFPLENPRR